MTWRLLIRHTSGYRYATPVGASYNEARITPLTTAHQTTVESHVDLVPAVRTYRYWDYWGTMVHAFDIHSPHSELIVTGTSTVETDEAVDVGDPAGWEDAKESADAYVELTCPTDYVPASAELSRAGAEVRSSDGPLVSAHQAAEWVRAAIAYEPGSTEVSTSALGALDAGRGVCQDFVHVFLGIVRSIGVPARYVSGYLHPAVDPAVGDSMKGQSHAWAEVWAGSWVPIDPTNGTSPGLRHVAVGRGRDYRDVAPLRGIYSGSVAHALDVEVDVTRLR